MLKQLSVRCLVGRVCILMAVAGSCQAAELHIGAATVTITPDKPVALSGQMRTRIATKVQFDTKK